MATTTALPPDHDPEHLKQEKDKLIESRAKFAATSELLFVILPFIVIAIILGHRGELKIIFFLPEWSIVSAVIVGQSVIKLVSMVLGRKKVIKESILLILSVLIVLWLVPILVILSIVLIADKDKVSCTLALTQAIMFFVSIAVFWWTSFVERHANEYPEKSSPNDA
jgi:hypothetical protein